VIESAINAARRDILHVIAHNNTSKHTTSQLPLL